MIKDPRQHVRKLGYHRIKKSRTLFKTGNVRKFKIPTLRFDADEYYGMIDWMSVEYTEPPLTKHL